MNRTISDTIFTKYVIIKRVNKVKAKYKWGFMEGIILQNEEKWSNYLWLALISFACFFLELLSMGIVFRTADGNYTIAEKSIHSILTACLWAISIAIIVNFSRKRYNYPEKMKNDNNICTREWLVTLLCLSACKLISFIDWHTLKIIGEFQIKEPIQFLTQYVYYIFEVGLICLIIIYGQKAFETLLKKKSQIPFGGLLLAFTWGAFHFISRGIDFWNGISCMIFSVLSGIMYLKLKRKVSYSYIFIALGYLL